MLVKASLERRPIARTKPEALGGWRGELRVSIYSIVGSNIFPKNTLLAKGR